MINMLAEHCMLKKGASREMPHGSSRGSTLWPTPWPQNSEVGKFKLHQSGK